MYDRSKWYEKLLAQIQAQDVGEVLKDRYALLLQVELGLHLIERLELSDEPITVLWVLLSDSPLQHPRLLALDAQQRHAIANARILLPFAGRFNWENALQTYAMMDEQWRRYRVSPDNLESQKVINFGSHEERRSVYDQALEGILPFARRTIEPAEEGQYLFDAITEQGKQAVTADIDKESADIVTINLPWFTEPRPRQTLEYSYDDFRNIARDLEDLRQRRDLTSTLGSQLNWLELVDEMLGYRAILSDGSLAARNKVPLRIDGHAYVVGAVASGKSMIAKLILSDAALYPEKERRITLVVSDTMSALNLADEFNTLFCKPGDPPVAVPLIGRSTRNQHLQRLHRSSKFRPEHWALRWLNPACPLQALATKAEFYCTRPGTEPCESLYTLSGGPEPRRKYHFCPLFAVCPSKQQYRDMPTACIWITTPGALGKSSVPSQLEKRKVSLTEIVYEQSDLVIFDEADTVQEWFDNLFAEEIVLTNGNDGLLDLEDVETALALVPRRTHSPSTRRWVEAERHSLVSISNILSCLTDRELAPMLRHWIERNYFTALTLAYKVLWRSLGLPKWKDCQGQERKEAIDKIRPLIAYFDKLNQKDPLKIKRPVNNAQEDPVYRLALIMRILLSAGDSTHNPIVAQECQAWILDFIPGIEQTLQKLQLELEEWNKQLPKKRKKADAEPPDPPDTLETLALRLEFVLNVMILDRNIRIVFYEWYSKPYIMSTDLNETSLKGAPDNLIDVLPIPPTGRVFGTYYSKGLEIGQDEQQKREQPSGLSVFSYSNIGRWYTMYFHKLFTELDQKRGPNVLSLSGTSWLPNSSHWHIDIPPQGILELPQDAQEAIKQSVFSYIPQYRYVDKNTQKRRLRDKKSQEDQSDDKQEMPEPIFISGEPKKMQPVKELMKALASDQNGQKSPLREELAGLQRLSQLEPDYWADRERLLLIVNSYDQARWAYQELRFSETYQGEICYLERNSAGRDEVVIDTDTAVYRSDIEDFARKYNGKILIAPMQAIGRGYNILNQYGKAAFGAIYFLTRPMPYPADTQALARELNRRTLDWCQRTSLSIWQKPLIYEQALALREKATEYWRKAELRGYYTQFAHEDTYNDKKYSESERFDLAATTAGHIIQACGRLLRGGVPFHAFFVDAAWAPKIARKQAVAECSRTSLLTAMLEVLQLYVQDQTGFALYIPIVEALKDIDGFEPKYRGEQ
ncbi:MAG TPA: hypothetical protein VGL94_21435 [Ktedonobacteraceae bacterium]|jgi:hypothetical protein